MTTLAIKDINTDRDRLQARHRMDGEVVADYADKMKAGVKFPPVIVFDDGKAKWLADGFHRIAGAVKAGLTEIDADVRAGTKMDALLCAVQANDEHGLKRSTWDKERAVELLLGTPEFADAAVAVLAEKCRVSDLIAQRVSDRLRQPTAETKFRGKDNRMHPARKQFKKRKATQAELLHEEERQREADRTFNAEVAKQTQDDIGALLGPEAAAAFVVREKFDEAGKLAARLAQLVNEIASMPGAELYRQKLRMEGTAGGERFRCTDLHNATTKLKDNRPYAARCPACQAAGHAANRQACQWCNGLPYVTERAYLRIKEAVQAGKKPGKAA